jgi:hypothetical protein
MDADFSVELAADDESLEFPWTAPDDSCRYYDLRTHPEHLTKLDEVQRISELGIFLKAVNTAESLLESAKCDTWSTNQLNPDEDIYDATCKFGSYIDLIFRDSEARFSFPAHENFLKHAIADLRHKPELPARAELLLRRCYFHAAQQIRDGFYITFYLFGYGEEESTARKNWGLSLKIAQEIFATPCRNQT